MFLAAPFLPLAAFAVLLGDADPRGLFGFTSFLADGLGAALRFELFAKT